MWILSSPKLTKICEPIKKYLRLGTLLKISTLLKVLQVFEYGARFCVASGQGFMAVQLVVGKQKGEASRAEEHVVARS